MVSLRDAVQTQVQLAFDVEGLESTFGRVELSRRPELGHFQCNGAMAAAKLARKPARELAEQIASRLESYSTFERVSVQGPGFINISVPDRTLIEYANHALSDPRCGFAASVARRRVVVDYGGPNVAKAMHVGHLRSSIIGDALQRLFRFVGNDVITDVHLGDWGLPMGMLISEIRRRRPDLPHFAEAPPSARFSDPRITLQDLEQMYPEAARRCREDKAALEEARQATVELQQGRPGYRALWEDIVSISTEALRRDFLRLGISFDLWLGESSAHPILGSMIDALRESGIAAISEGAVVVPISQPTDDKEIPPLILINSDGGHTYATTDLATIVQRVDRFKADLIVYVVDQRQALHFEQVFRAIRQSRITAPVQLEHVGFGTVNGPDGKPFKTRAGGVMKLGDLIKMATDEATKRIEEAGLAESLEQREKGEIAERVGIAAIKFADLSNHRLSDYVFDLARFTSFEGKTGPYILYSAVRAKSLLTKAASAGASIGTILSPTTETERRLVLCTLSLPDVIHEAYDKRLPSLLCEWAFELAQAFNSFYHACHVLSETDNQLRASRLSLVSLVLREIELVADILGMPLPDRM